jgi:hypothetical protein
MQKRRGDEQPMPDDLRLDDELQPYEEQRFWDSVDEEIDAMDWQDFQEFLSADQLPHQPRPSFEVRLRQRLRALMLRRN